jgi:hypothetical protein
MLGSAREVPFVIDPNASSPGPDAPGSSPIKPEATPEVDSPLDSWLKALFGSG